jgi:uncharacterized HAD superfamily protein/hypoxanthine phosphoribosyltransferase
MKQSMHYRSIDDMNQVILRNLHKVPEDVDLVVGIPRSGLLAANILSLYLNRTLTDLEGLREGRLLGKGKRNVPGFGQVTIQNARRILVVDDCVSQGTEMRRARKFIEDLGLTGRTTFLSVFSFPQNPGLSDIVFQIIPRPMCFQWSFMHTPELKQYCLDIDGVICRDATKEEDDDGPRYEQFLREATPLFLPTAEVGWLVTSRLEKYRGITEVWLARHNVRFGELIMMDLPSKAEREQSGRHAAFKAEAYKRTGAILFVESCPLVAEQVAELSGLPVMSMTANRLVGNPQLERHLIRIQRARRTMKRIMRAPRKVLSRIMGRTAAPATMQ